MLRLGHPTLKGKVAIVTGGGRGMGEMFVKNLAINGAKVAVCDVNYESAGRVSEDVREAGGVATPFEVDVSDFNKVDDTIRRVAAELGAPDILVNNAGILKTTRFTEISPAEWDKLMAVNVDGVFFCCRAVVPMMIAKKYGKIINVSSTAGKSASTFGGLHYTASKAAVLGITRHLARELAGHHINVNAICPGSIDTPMVKENASPQIIAEGVGKIPWGRLGTPEEVSNLVLFLSSDASSYVTGASIDINGGELLV